MYDNTEKELNKKGSEANYEQSYSYLFTACHNKDLTARRGRITITALLYFK